MDDKPLRKHVYKIGKRFVSRLMTKSRTFHVGTFDTPEEAWEEREKLRIELEEAGIINKVDNRWCPEIDTVLLEKAREVFYVKEPGKEKLDNTVPNMAEKLDIPLSQANIIIDYIIKTDRMKYKKYVPRKVKVISEYRRHMDERIIKELIAYNESVEDELKVNI